MVNWFKEFFALAKMLFKKTNISSDVEIIKMNNFPFTGYAYMAWCGKVVTKKDIKWDEIKTEIQNEELGHLKQASFYKYWFQYYLVYVWEWIKGGPVMNPASAAYFTIPFEVQAKANRHKDDYDYNRDDLKNKYTLKNRKKIYRKYRDDWENFCRSL